jgi:hypothetical protein
MEQQKLWVEPVGGIIVARLRGTCTEEMLTECQARVLVLANDTHQVKVLYDALEMDAPDVDLVFLQQRLEAETKKKLGSAQLRSAILVPNSRIALLARIAFGASGEGEYRVFYNDMAQAVMWLEGRV